MGSSVGSTAVQLASACSFAMVASASQRPLQVPVSTASATTISVSFQDLQVFRRAGKAYSPLLELYMLNTYGVGLRLYIMHNRQLSGACYAAHQQAFQRHTTQTTCSMCTKYVTSKQYKASEAQPCLGKEPIIRNLSCIP